MRMCRIDPQVMIVITARSAFEYHECLAGVGGIMQRLSDDIQPVRITGRHRHAALVPGGHGRSVVDLLPMSAAIIGAIQPTVLGGIDRRINANRLADTRHSQSDAA